MKKEKRRSSTHTDPAGALVLKYETGLQLINPSSLQYGIILQCIFEDCVITLKNHNKLEMMIGFRTFRKTFQNIGIYYVTSLMTKIRISLRKKGTSSRQVSYMTLVFFFSFSFRHFKSKPLLLYPLK